ncbi:hypothetical protein [Zoogloea sp.]|uniref:hypothetical protein n=1 Tax=Zoogloea sp. TaxID=49181 RepID=UPI0035B48A54
MLIGMGLARMVLACMNEKPRRPSRGDSAAVPGEERYLRLNQARQCSADELQAALSRWGIPVSGVEVDGLVTACVRGLGASQKLAALLASSEGSRVLEAEIGLVACQHEELGRLLDILRER